MNNISQLQKPATEISVTIRDTAFTIPFPTSGQMIDIAVLKSKLSENQYNSLFLQSSLEGPIAVKLIDAYSFFQVMAPELKNSLTLKSFYDLSVLDSLELIEVFESQVQAWLNDWTLAINSRIDELRGKANEKKKLV